MPMSRAAGAAARLALALLALGLAACPRPAPVVQPQSYAPARGALRKLAVLPFSPRSEPGGSAQGQAAPLAAEAELVGRFVTEAVSAQGIRVIPAGDLAIALAGEGQPPKAVNLVEAARVAAREFGATAVLRGEVWRYRERAGESLGASGAASVAFEVTLFAAPGGEKLWSARFDETQRPLSENLLNAPRYPGGGTRWLTAAELARWGAQAIAQAMPHSP